MNVIETERLILREWKDSEEDKAQLHEILSSPITMRFWPAPFSLEQTEAWIKNNIARYRQLGFGRWAVVLKKENQIIGDCGVILAEINGRQENDLGYIIHHPYWHQGFATEAALACKDYAFSKLGLKRLCANMPVDHEGSIKTAVKLGMKLEKEFYNSRNRNIRTYLYSV